MKYRVFAITLLVMMVLNIFRFEIPYIQYDIFRDYIAQNLCVNKDKKGNCCQGKCFLDKQIKLSNENNNANENNNSKKLLNSEVKEFLCSHSIIPKAVEKTLSPQCFIEILRIPDIAFAIFVPPKF
jgi:hypothetical protein